VREEVSDTTAPVGVKRRLEVAQFGANNKK